MNFPRDHVTLPGGREVAPHEVLLLRVAVDARDGALGHGGVLGVRPPLQLRGEVLVQEDFKLGLPESGEVAENKSN